MHRDIRWPDFESLVVIMPNLLLFMNPLRATTFSSREASESLFFSLYGSAGLLPVSALEKCCWPDIVVCVRRRENRWLVLLLLQSRTQFRASDGLWLV